MQDLKNIIESLLFVSEEPLTVDKMKGVIETADKTEIRSALQELGAEYESRAGGFYLSEVAGGYQLRSRPTYHEYIKRLLQPSPQRLSRAALETLAVVAYRQPVIRADIEHIRGVDCGAMLRQLLERKLLRVLGRKEIPGRPLIYATTKTFLELFELKDLSELPTPAEIEQMGAVFNSEPLNDEPDPEEEPAPESGDESPIADQDADPIDGDEDGQSAEPAAASIPSDTAVDDDPSPIDPPDPEADQPQVVKTAEPSTDETKTAPPQPDRDGRPGSLQETLQDDNL